MTRISLLGSTGSIGTQALDVARATPGEFEIVALAAGSNVELLAQQVLEWKPQMAVLFDSTKWPIFQDLVGSTTTQLAVGMDGLLEAAALPDADLVLGAMLGAAGLQPTLAAIEAGKDVAIANKETLVAGGEVVMRAAREHGVRLWPVDSEHCALAQCLLGEDTRAVRTLTITASGGPFWEKSREEIAAAKPEDALKHPTWTMGRKITIDSATLANKGLEMIEAHHLFGVPMDNIDIVVHRQSIVHSFVTFSDGSVKAQLGQPDMKLPIQWGLARGKRGSRVAPELPLAQMGTLTFEAPDDGRFPSVALAREAMRRGGVAPCVFNAANEVAVEAFLNGSTHFYGITDCIASTLERLTDSTRRGDSLRLEDVLEADSWARQTACSLLNVI
ncbi:1-deoxy-D-xylulose 5-phosphate reductoisomerase [Abditibacteriota bacterium]|nr:1-deoxy-D-xylulose 5-phosphate reductoisomerase [Abditibacteriota bacterium]